MGSRLHGNDGRPRVPTVMPINPELHISVIPAQEDPCTTVIPATAGIRRGGGDGFPSPRERRAAARPYRHSHQPRTSHIRHSRAGRPLHNRHSRDGGNPGAAGMGSRLHGNDGRPRVPTVIPINPELHISVIPAQEDPCTTVIPATAGIRRRRGWVPVSTGTTGGRASLPSFLPNQYFAYPSFPRRKTLHIRHSRDGGNPTAAGMGSRLHGNDGRQRVSATIPPPRREHTAHAPPHPCRGPCTTVIPAAYPSFPLHNRHSRDGGNPGVEGMGSRLHGNDEWHPVSAASPPLRREYIVSTFTRTGRRRVWRRRSRSGAALPCPRASPARRRRRSAPASAPSCRSGSGSRPS